MQQLMKFIRYILPSPFTIGVILTLCTFLLALCFQSDVETSSFDYTILLAGYWKDGFWELLSFAMQMVIMLLLGHVIALSKPSNTFIQWLIGFIKNGATAAFVICFFTIAVSLFNWGLGLIFGAIMARKVGEKLSLENKTFNYGLLGAAGYSGLMVWHGGLSGSAPLKVADAGHFLEKTIGIISMDQTVFSSMNIVASILLLIVLPSLLYLIGKRSKSGNFDSLSELSKDSEEVNTEEELIDLEKITGAEKLDYWKFPAYIFGGIVVAISFGVLWSSLNEGTGISFINTNYINFLLFGVAIILHGSFHRFLIASTHAVGDTLGIILQFPIYAGIMGIMKYSGLTGQIALFFIEIANTESLPLLTLISSGMVNLFVPSGGGQWAVQGEIVVESARNLNVPVAKNIMALAYGDQLTNMLQPFWALPLLGITKLKAKDIFPYTFILFLTGFLIFTAILILF